MNDLNAAAAKLQKLENVRMIHVPPVQSRRVTMWGEP